MKSIGEKPFAYDKVTRQPVWAHRATHGRAYWFPDGDCYRHTSRTGGYFFQFAPGTHGGGAPGGARETLVHEIGKMLIVERLRVAARTSSGIVYVVFRSAVSEEALDHRRPDVSGVVEECYPRVLRRGAPLHVEVHVTNPVDEQKQSDMLNRGEAVLEIDLPRKVEQIIRLSVSDDKSVDDAKRSIFRELVACPPGRWVVAP